MLWSPLRHLWNAYEVEWCYKQSMKFLAENFNSLWTCYELDRDYNYRDNLNYEIPILKISYILIHNSGVEKRGHHNHEKMFQFGTFSQSYLQNFSLSNIIFLLNENILGCWT